METKEDILNYIGRYCEHHWTELEQKARAHYIAQVKFLKYKDRNEKYAEKYNQMNSNDPKVLDLLKDGYPKFRERVIERIYKEHWEEMEVNRCSKCNGLARTPNARQCRFCQHDWH